MQYRDVYNSVKYLLRDTKHEVLNMTFFKLCLNRALIDIVVKIPEANSQTLDITAVDGTYQTIPSTVFRLLRIDALKAADDTYIKRLRKGDASQRDMSNPEWVACNAGDPDYYLYDKHDEGHFWLTPGATAGQKVQCIASVKPAVVTDLDIDLEISDQYYDDLINGVYAYMLDRGFGGMSRIQYYHNRYVSGVSSDAQLNVINSPESDNG